MGIENDTDGLKDDAAVKTEKTGKGPTYLFLSYARDDDEPFVRRLYEDLKRQRDNGWPLFEVWFDRESMPSRQLTLHHEIRSAINACDRLILVVGPHAVTSDYVTQEWQFAHLVAKKCVNPIVRLDGNEPDGTITDGYGLIPEELKVHAEDFRDDRSYAAHLIKLIRQLSEPLPPVGKLVAVPELPPGFRAQPERLKVLRDLLLADLQKPVVISGAKARVGMQGMGGIGKSVLANAMARHPEVRRAFKDGIYWVALGQQPNILDLQHWLARELGGDAVFENEFTGREQLRELLLNRETLLILDNVWERGHAEAFNVVGSLGRILLTTRDTGLVTALAARENHYRVDLPSRAEAEALLASAAEVDPADLKNHATAVEIIHRCGRLPLALALCGGMVRGGTTWEDVLEALRNHDLAFLSIDHPAEEQHRNIWTAMNASLHALPHEQQSRFADLAVFALDTGAVDTAVATLWEHTGGLSPRDSRKLLADFARRSLVVLTEIEGEAPRKRIVLHDLLHSFASGMAQKHLGSEVTLHNVLLDAYRNKCPKGWSTGPDDGYFLQNLCRHLLNLGYWNQLIGDENQPGILTDLLWIDKKVRAGQVFGLVGDYNAALEALPEFRDEAELERQTFARCRRYGEELIRHARNPDVFPLPAPPPTFGRNAGATIPEERSERARRLRHFSNFVSINTWTLTTLSDQTIEIAANYEAEGALAKSAREHLANMKRPWLRCYPCHPVTHPLRSQCLRVLGGHANGIYSVRITPDGRFAISGSHDKTVRVWDLRKGTCVRILKEGNHPVLSVNITPDGKRAVSQSYDHVLCIWDLENGQLLGKLEGGKGLVWSVNITPDVRFAVSASEDNLIRIWSLNSGLCLRAFQGGNTVSITPNGRLAVSGNDDRTLRVWDLNNGRLLSRIKGHVGSIRCVSITPDGRLAISGSVDQTLRVWDIEHCKCLGRLEGHMSLVTSVSITPDGRQAISGSYDKTVRVWDLEDMACLCTLRGHKRDVRCVDISADGKIAISGSMDQTLIVWDLKGGESFQTHGKHLDWINSVSITPNGRKAVSGSDDKTIRVWDLESGKCVRTLQANSHEIRSVSITADGRHAVSASKDRTLRVWDLESGMCLCTLKGHENWVYCASITLDGRLAVSGSKDTTLRVWNLESRKCLRTFENSVQVISASITIDGRLAVWTCDRMLRSLDLESGEYQCTFKGHNGLILDVSVTPDGRCAVSGSKDQTLRVWNLANGTCLHILRGHKDWVYSVSITPDGRLAVSGSYDRTARVWDLVSGKCLAIYNSYAGIVAVASSTSRYLGGTEDGHLIFLTPCNFPPIGPAIATLYRIPNAFKLGTYSYHAPCTLCQAIFDPSPVIVDTINYYTGSSSRPLKKQSTIHHLPDYAFEDPRLLAACPGCSKPLRFNPFFVDIFI